MEAEDLQPSVDLLESMRSVGYSLGAALADLIDNSITAAASHVEIEFDVIEGKCITILDDGRGISPPKAREALRLAGSVGDRAADDLGRFGLGLKTASLSQARRLTLVTKQQDTVTALRWDIDYVKDSGKWAVLVLDQKDISELPLHEELMSKNSGTLVIWHNLDLLLGDSSKPGPFLAEKVVSLRHELGLTFHRYLSEKRSPLKITLNGTSIGAIDPFLKKNPKTQRSGTEPMFFGKHVVQFEAFTLPHSSHLSRAERRRHDLGEGMRDAQGFYFYRNRRLISYGSWHGLAKMNELSKQTRVQVDVPSELDSLWQLDIKKSKAEPPATFKQRLRQLLRPILEQSHRVHTFRGRRENREIEHIWNKIRTEEGFRYEINTDSPIVISAIQDLSDVEASRIHRLLQLISNTFPVLDAYAEVAANHESQALSETSEEIRLRLVDIHKSGLLSSDPKIALTQLAQVEPFNNILGLEQVINKIWKG